MALTESIGQAPDTLGPLATLLVVFQSVTAMIEANWPFAKPRQHVINTTPALRERELAKHAALTASLSVALEARGIARLHAALAAETGMTAFIQAIHCWFQEPQRSLEDHLNEALSVLRQLAEQG